MGGPGCARDLSRDQQVATADTDDFSDTHAPICLRDRRQPTRPLMSACLSLSLPVCLVVCVCVCVCVLVCLSVLPFDVRFRSLVLISDYQCIN